MRLYGETNQLVLLIAGIEETRVIDSLFLAHCMEILLSSLFKLDDIQRPSFIEIFEEGVVFSRLELELIEVVILIVEHIRSSFLLISPINSPLRQAIQLLKLSQPLQ